MKIKKYILLFGILSFFLIIFNCSKKTEVYKVALITWRGETISEKVVIQKLLNTYNKEEIIITEFDANQNIENLNKIIETIKSQSFNLIYSFGTTVTKELQNHITNTPIVFSAVWDPVGSKIVSSLAAPNSNITGVTHSIPVKIQFEYIQKIFNVKKIGFLYNPNELNSQIAKNQLIKLNPKFNFDIVVCSLSDINLINSVINDFKSNNVDFVFLPSDSFLLSNGKQIIESLSDAGIPTYGAAEDYITKHKALCGTYTTYEEMGQKAAEKCIEILNGKNPKNIPVSSLDNIQFVINAQTAKKINFDYDENIFNNIINTD